MPSKPRVRPLRGERRSRPLPVAPLFALAILAVGITYAQQNLPAPTQVPAAQPPAAGSEPEPAQDAAAAPAAAATAAPADAPQATTPAATPAAAKGSPQRFEPTEKVRADFDVAFPVDI
jgi:hypothetical protein